MRFDIEKHNDLMRRWKEKDIHKNEKFIKDGIIDPARWEKADKKILLLLKEAYGEIDDLCSWIRDKEKGPKGKIWWTVSYWLYALRKMTDKSMPSFPNKEQWNECKEFLLSSSVVNIKKSNGQHSSSSDNLEKYVKEDHDMIKEQLSLIDPTIILCGYTFDFFKKYIWPPAEIRPLGNTKSVFQAGKHIVIDWWHPANQYPNELCYYALCAIVQEAKLNS